MSRLTDELEEIKRKVDNLKLYTVRFITAKDFINYVEEIRDRFQKFPEIMLMGYFDNAFTEIFEENYPKYRDRCKVRVICHGFPKNNEDNPNRLCLEALADLGVEVKVSVDTHARIFIGYNKERPHNSELLLGSFDFNRDGLSRRKANAGIRTRNEYLVQEAVAFFESTWDKKRSVPLEDYIN